MLKLEETLGDDKEEGWRLKILKGTYNNHPQFERKVKEIKVE